MMMYNFAAGPAMLPSEVHEQIVSSWFNWQNTGVPLVELGHRTEPFTNLLQHCEQLLRELMNIPSRYHVLFLQGGAQGQFAGVPMNLLGKKTKALYLTYGTWSSRAASEAARYGDISTIDLKTQTKPYGLINFDTLEVADNQHDFAYTHYCSNETIEGIRLPREKIKQISTPLVVDMSSDILSNPINVESYDLIYACTQKNLGISGLAIVIIADHLLDQAMSITPSIFHYKTQVAAHSLINTPNTFACYVTSLVLEWLKKQGGTNAIAKINKRKAEKLYRYIDTSQFYQNFIDPFYRSNTNICFYLPNKTLEDRFLKQSSLEGLLFLRGHKLAGGIRASLYNAVPEKAVDTLIDFMKHFALSAIGS